MTGITDIDDTLVTMSIQGESANDVLTYFYTLRSLARKIETEPCTIRCETTTNDTNHMHAEFDFCCAVEKVIFQLNCAFNSQYKH